MILRILLALIAATAVSAAEARPRRAAPAPAISVDVSRLRAIGLPVQAAIVEQVLLRELSAAPASGRVIVRITGLSLNAFAGSSGFGFKSFGSGGMSSDYLEGEFQVLGPQGEVLAGRPMVVNAPASSGGAYYLPDNERRRVEVLARNFAGWVRRYGS